MSIRRRLEFGSYMIEWPDRDGAPATAYRYATRGSRVRKDDQIVMYDGSWQPVVSTLVGQPAYGRRMYRREVRGGSDLYALLETAWLAARAPYQVEPLWVLVAEIPQFGDCGWRGEWPFRALLNDKPIQPNKAARVVGREGPVSEKMGLHVLWHEHPYILPFFCLDVVEPPPLEFSRARRLTVRTRS